ncbi:hypothetical protein CLV35_0993 [Motilibacter peucedani]|uniref:Uncharacterized protein n=1 Tax=Motilibacter peucedani TaxID=598650 RepID=A0A420XUP2_9ACTN|nr:hypothetical protein [Motilibacter peucedani]RKS80556.1 hypothetical protein CLV35_0993 [Motilibacter peucedani]
MGSGDGWELVLQVVDATGGSVRVATLRWDRAPTPAELLGALAEEAAAAHRDGQRVVVAGAPPGIGRLLEAAGFTAFLDAGGPAQDVGQAAVSAGGSSNAGNSEVSR